MYWLIVCFLVLIIFLNIRLYKFDILSPSFLYNCSMLISIICSIIGLSTWNDVYDLSYPTCLIIILSILFFNIGELAIRHIIKFKKAKKHLSKEIVIRPQKIITVLSLIFVIITFFCLLHEVVRISRIVGYTGNNIFDIIKAYRSTSILFTTSFIKQGIHLNIIVAQMQKAIEVICYVYLYIIISNFFYKKFQFSYEYIFSIFIVCICILTSLLIGSRMQLFIYIVYSFVILIILYGMKHSYKTILFKYWKKVLLIGLSCVILFYCLLPLTGRESKSNPIDYITFYFGAPIPTLNKYLETSQNKPNFFGEETFRGAQNIMFKLGLSDYIQPITTKWISFNVSEDNIMHSNIYTSGKRYYHDFGYLGIILIQFINGFIFAYFYIIMRNKKTSLSIIFYAMCSYMIIDQVRDEYLFSTFVHINTLFKFIILFFLLYFSKHNLKEVRNEITNRKLN